MKLLIDASRANACQRTGVEWYSFHIINALKKVVPPNVEVVLYTREKIRSDLADLPKNWTHKRLMWPPKKFWTQVRLSCEMLRYKNKQDTILFIPASAPPIIHPKFVVTIHDIGFIRIPECYSMFSCWYQKWSTRYALKKSSSIVTPSLFTRSELINEFEYDSEKIFAIPHGSVNVVKDNQGAEPFMGFTNFFLYVGRIEHKKNIKNLIKAFEIFKRQVSGSHKLVLVGSPGVGYDEIMDRVKISHARSSIVFPGYLDDKELSQVYASSRALVFPSIYEGFGLPLLEAMASSIPVMCSDIPPHREVAQEAALFSPVNDVRILAQNMRTMVVSGQKSSQLVYAGNKRVSQFSWEKSAKDTWGVIKSVAKF